MPSRMLEEPQPNLMPMSRDNSMSRRARSVIMLVPIHTELSRSGPLDRMLFWRIPNLNMKSTPRWRNLWMRDEETYACERLEEDPRAQSQGDRHSTLDAVFNLLWPSLRRRLKRILLYQEFQGSSYIKSFSSYIKSLKSRPNVVVYLDGPRFAENKLPVDEAWCDQLPGCAGFSREVFGFPPNICGNHLSGNCPFLLFQSSVYRLTFCWIRHWSWIERCTK